MDRRIRWSAAAFWRLEPRLLPSVTIDVRYDFDTSNFFNTQAKRDLMQQAANTVAATLNDSLAAIVPFGSNTWSANFTDPSTGLPQSLANPTVPADTMFLFVGGRPLSGTEAGLGATSGFSAHGSTVWLSTVGTRGQAGAGTMPATDFGPWGGSIAFDTGSTNFFFGTTTAGLGPTQTDFYSVALHELGHVLGIGTADSWNHFVSGTTFIGPNAEAANSGVPVPLQPGGAHWAEGTTSGGQVALMTPTLPDGTRRLFTPLDVAGLADVGWQVTPPPAGTLAFSTNQYFAAENAGTATITVNRSGGSTGTVSVAYATLDGTGQAGTNYTAASGTLTFGPGVTSQSFTVPLLDDHLITGDFTVKLQINDAQGTTLGSPQNASLTIAESDGKKPSTPGDYDGDGHADLALFRPTTATWFIKQSTAGGEHIQFGAPGDIPLVGDFDADGKTDLVLFRPSTATWFVLRSSAGPMSFQFGAPRLDIPVVGDFNGDGTADFGVFRPTTDEWFVALSNGGHMHLQFGAPGIDRPEPADYNGDGTTNFAVYRPTTGRWFIQGVGQVQLGQPGDIAVPGVYDGGTSAEAAMFRPSTDQWIINSPGGVRTVSLGQSSDLAVPADYDGDGRTNVATFQPSSATWLVGGVGGPGTATQFGAPNLDIPVERALDYVSTTFSGVRTASNSFGAVRGLADVTTRPALATALDFGQQALGLSSLGVATQAQDGIALALATSPPTQKRGLATS